jgi:L-ascorbate metabolism protein UlaG (beta-lactamase superfamily)
MAAIGRTGPATAGDGRLDGALLPIGGWGATLPPGHLDPRRAAEAVALLQPQWVVPIHWGSLRVPGLWRLYRSALEGRLDEFAAALAREAPDTRLMAVRPGESFPLPQAAGR